MVPEIPSVDCKVKVVVPPVTANVSAVYVNRLERPYPKVFQPEPLETITKDSVSCSCWFAFPSIVSAPDGVRVRMPEPLLRTMQNQFAPTADADGRVNAPTPPFQTTSEALRDDASVWFVVYGTTEYAWFNVMPDASKPYPASADALAADVPAPRVTEAQTPAVVLLSVR